MAEQQPVAEGTAKGTWLSKLSPEERKEVARKGAQARKANFDKRKLSSATEEAGLVKFNIIDIHGGGETHPTYSVYGSREAVQALRDIIQSYNGYWDMKAQLERKNDELIQEVEELKKRLEQPKPTVVNPGVA